MIEVIASTALLAITISGFLMMAEANAGLLAKEHALSGSTYELCSMAAEGGGEKTGGVFEVEFYMEGASDHKETGVTEQFDEYQVSKDGRNGSMTFYRHR